MNSRNSKKYQIKHLELTKENNPSVWTEDDLMKITNNEVVIGYIMRFNNTTTCNLYTLDKKYVKGDIVDLTELQNSYAEWLYNAIYNGITIKFKNPPMENWLDTKEQWIKKTANKLSKAFNKPFEEMMSHVYYAIIKVYNNKKAYIGNLGYIEKSAYNEVLLEIRANKSKFIIDDNKVISLDSTVNTSGDEQELTYHDLLGKEDDTEEELAFTSRTNDIKKVLLYTFSQREVDQIINSSGQLPLSLYRKLLNWRKTHKRGDFDVER